VVLVLFGGREAAAYVPQDLEVEWWTGSGAHRALLVVDFWPDNGAADSFAFGCRFDQPQITGLQLLNALEDAGQGFSFAEEWGFVTDIWYVKDGTTYHTGYNWPYSYWSYWISVDRGESWDYSWYGAGDRILVDGDGDGWLAKPGDDETSEPVTPLALSLPGDLDCSGIVDFGDINPFVLALMDPVGYYAAFPGCQRMNADVSGDGHVSFEDIDPFIALLGRAE
jgi:hypothetical protein